MCFHLGVLRFLAECGQLERVDRVSTVSGGSLLLGLMLREADLRWPSSTELLEAVYPRLREKLCARSLQWGALRELARPWNWRFILSRSNLLALALQREWSVSARLADLPAHPEWSINGTTAETGKRFRFKRDSLGDWVIGYAAPGNFPLAAALAVSAAFPGGFGPLTFDATRFAWKRRPWGVPLESARPIDPDFKRLHLYDGGVYDNLGLEPFFDSGTGTTKRTGDAILVSDAGAPFAPGFGTAALNPWRLKRVADIMSEQSRALRVRAFTAFVQRDAAHGAYLYIGLPAPAGGSVQAATLAARHPTTLVRPTKAQFDAIVQHGYQLAADSSAQLGLRLMLDSSTTATQREVLHG